MQIHGLNKTTLLDFPGHVACTVFTGGCNFRCPFCHNADLVLAPHTQPEISEESFFDFLKKRSAILEGVCITGGEPLLQNDLADFIRRIRALGLLVKLDTNGYLPQRLEALLQEGLLDYVAMDIKSSRKGYAAAAGLDAADHTAPNGCNAGAVGSFDLSRIEKSIALLKTSGIPYEFRTTVVKGLHTQADFEEIAAMISGCEHYYLQSYEEKDSVLMFHMESEAHALCAFTPEELRSFARQLNDLEIPTSLRGIS